MKKTTLLFSIALVALLSSPLTYGQNIGINATGATPNTSAMLDVDATNKGVLIPRVALTAANVAGPVATPATSLLVYNTATAGTAPNNVTPGFYYWNGARWEKISNDQDAWKITGNSNATSGIHFLGTTNAQALDFRTNNTIRFRVADANQVHGVVDGTAALPFYSFANNTGIGMYRAGANILGFSTSGSERMRVMANGDVLVGSTTYLGSSGAGDKFTSFKTSTAIAWAVNGISTDVNGGAVYGEQSVASGYNSIEGISVGTGSAVAGLLLKNSGTGNGVRGASNSWQGIGISGSRVNNGGSNTGFGGLFQNDLGYTGGSFNVSDARLKQDIKPIQGALSKITAIQGVNYVHNFKEYPYLGLGEGLQYGFIAQDLKQVIPELVAEKMLDTEATKPNNARSESNAKYELFNMVNYTALIPVLVEAIKEQQEIIESQNNRIEALETSIQELKEAINSK